MDWIKSKVASFGLMPLLLKLIAVCSLIGGPAMLFGGIYAYIGHGTYKIDGEVVTKAEFFTAASPWAISSFITCGIVLTITAWGLFSRNAWARLTYMLALVIAYIPVFIEIKPSLFANALINALIIFSISYWYLFRNKAVREYFLS